MSDPTTDPATGEGPEPRAESAWQRRRRLEAVFGDTLPDTTSDEQDPPGADDNEAWLKAQVPPHHGG
ncbi:hypothetical protein [Nocardioides sp. cx-173]|uniref:hypothetical protein n=1 Tax=Nocardioides sp. cx-173 TaxID=2898796 RepID=UPI001E355947|nr:hypothetical protein [Nocardioides sp. cx-173]MCD4526858.1 hypothetical protein [Nocardioides sp. cx-173]UGB41353.1 hypothetical protein LQ940_18530 [Nocardioides sp. cx-173]